LTAKKAAQHHLKKQIPEKPYLQNGLTPNYSFGCKRITFSNDYYPALTLPHVKLHRRKIVRVESDALCTEDGRQKIDVPVKSQTLFQLNNCLIKQLIDICSLSLNRFLSLPPATVFMITLLLWKLLVGIAKMFCQGGKMKDQERTLALLDPQLQTILLS